MNILALDAATTTGFAHSNGKHGIWNLGPATIRLRTFKELIDKAIQEWGCDCIAYEQASYGAGGRKGEGGVQWQTIVFHNQLRGIIELVSQERMIKCQAFHPSTIKAFATGNGRAKKEQMIAACITHYKFKPIDDNEADAVFILELAKRPDCWPKPKEKQVKPRLFRNSKAVNKPKKLF